MKVIDINDYKNTIKKIKKLNKKLDFLSNQMIKKDNTKKLKLDMTSKI